MPIEFKKRFSNYIEPFQAFSYAVQFLLNAIWPGAPAQPHARDQAFAEWYKTLGHHFSAFEDTTSVPALVASARGIILELGPATGNQLPRYSISKITHAYGIEPNHAFLDPLNARIKETGLDDLYTPITCGIEDVDLLQKYGIVDDTVDSILSIQVLCSVSDPAKAAEVIYRLLKPGGELIFWEHHASHDWITRIVQRIWNILWPLVIGGCQLNRPTVDLLLNAGTWEVIELNGDEDPWSLFPRAWGRLRKIDNGVKTSLEMGKAQHRLKV